MFRRVPLYLFTLLASLTFFSAPTLGQPFVQLSNPTSTTHWIKSGDALFGFNAYGGGYLSCLKLGPNAKKGAYCPSAGAAMQNMAAPGYGRGWQIAIRDKLHSGRHNPTQAGFRDSCGAFISMQAGESCAGQGGRLYMPPFAVPLFSDHVFDFTQHEDLCPDSYSDDGGNTDNDGVAEAGVSQVAELRSEFDYAGYYEDATDLVSADVSILRHVLQLDYVREPEAMLQFGENAVKDDGSAVLNPTATWLDLAPDEYGPPELAGPQVATATDYASGAFVYSGRARQSQGYDHALWIDSAGDWQAASTAECNSFRRVQVHEDQHKDLFDGNPNSLMGGSPSKFDGFTDQSLLVISTGGVGEVDTAKGIGLYLPSESPCNAMQTVGVQTATGEIVYAQDRRSRLLLTAQRRACGNDEGAKPTSTMGVPGDTVQVENDLSKFAVRLYFLGLLAPGNGLAGVHERLRMDLYMLVGTPSEIRAAYEELEASGEMAKSDCRISLDCLPPEDPPVDPDAGSSDPNDAGSDPEPDAGGIDPEPDAGGGDAESDAVGPGSLPDADAATPQSDTVGPGPKPDAGVADTPPDAADAKSQLDGSKGGFADVPTSGRIWDSGGTVTYPTGGFDVSPEPGSGASTGTASKSGGCKSTSAPSGVRGLLFTGFLLIYVRRRRLWVR